MGKIILSCGHEDPYRPSGGWPLTTKSWEGKDRTISYRVVCHKCFLDFISKYPEDVLFDAWEEDDYINGED